MQGIVFFLALARFSFLGAATPEAGILQCRKALSTPPGIARQAEDANPADWQVTPALKGLPQFLRLAWTQAQQVWFPLGKVDAKSFSVLFNDIAPEGDASILRFLLVHDSFRKEKNIGLGRFKGTSVLIEAVLESSEGLAKAVLLSINNGRKKKRYLVQLDLVGNRITPDSSPKEDRVWSIVEWESLDDRSKEWFAASPKAEGMSVYAPGKAIFRRVNDPRFKWLGLSWRDEETGLTWSGKSRRKMPLKEAMRFCEAMDGELPSQPMLESLSASRKLIFSDENEEFWITPSSKKAKNAMKGSGSYFVICVGH